MDSDFSLVATILRVLVSMRVRHFLFALVAVCVGAVAYWALTNREPIPRYALTAAPDPSGGTWLKLAPVEDGSGRPAQWNCKVTGFSGVPRWRLSKPAVLERESKWREDEIVMKWPHDFRGETMSPPAGRYEAECTVFVLDDAGVLVQAPLVKLEFRRE